MEKFAESIYREMGEIAVLVFHGLTTTPLAMEDTINYLTANGYTVYAPLLPGHGTTPEDLNNTEYTEWVETALKSYNELKDRGFEKIFVLGHSMGGVLALRLGELHADMKGLIISAAPMVLKGLLIKLTRLLKRFLKFKKKKGPREQYFKGGRRISYDVWPIKSVHELLKLIDITKKELRSIISPIMLIYGVEDEMVDILSLDMIYENVSSKVKRRLVLEGVGHNTLTGPKMKFVHSEIVNFIKEMSVD